MYKVLFVDDEPRSLEILNLLIRWEDFGFLPCGECSNGRDALLEIERQTPDLVITDIRMPEMDGLDLIAHVREKGNVHTKFIILSGYSEFEYAKRAMKYEVNHYVLKPITQEELLQELIEIRKQLDLAVQERESRILDHEATLQDLFSRIIQGDTNEEILSTLECLLGATVQELDWNCILIEFSESAYNKLEDRQSHHAKANVQRILEEKRLYEGPVHVLDLSVNTLALLIGQYRTEDNEPIYKQTALGIHQSITEVLSDDFTFAVGQYVDNAINIRRSYLSACEALDFRFFAGTGKLIFHSEVKPRRLAYHEMELNLAGVILEAVENHNRQSLEESISKLFEEFTVNITGSDLVRMLVFNILYQSQRRIAQWNGNPAELTEQYAVSEMENKNVTLPELKKLLTDYTLNCCEYIRELKERNAGRSFYKIDEYIRQNYKRNLTIKELAGQLYFHPIYLGQLITKKLGMSFNEYLHKLRIDEAKLLLEKSDKKTHEIAEVLGYCSYVSFLTQFEKYTGKKPGEFKSEILKKKAP